MIKVQSRPRGDQVKYLEDQILLELKRLEMKNELELVQNKLVLYVIAFIGSLTLLFMTGCAGGGGSGAQAESATPPTSVIAPISSPVATPTATATPTPTATPITQPQASAPTPSPTPAPTATPTPLSCNLTSGNIFCTGGNLGAAMAQINLVTQTGTLPAAYASGDREIAVWSLVLTGSTYCANIEVDNQFGLQLSRQNYCGTNFNVSTDVLQ